MSRTWGADGADVRGTRLGVIGVLADFCQRAVLVVVVNRGTVGTLVRLGNQLSTSATGRSGEDERQSGPRGSEQWRRDADSP